MERLTFATTATVEGRTLSGVAHTYGTVTTDGRNISFKPGALGASMKGNVVSFAYHDETKPLASTDAGTLRLQDDGQQFHFAIDLPESSYADDMKAYVGAGNKLEMSFQYAPAGRPSISKGMKLFGPGRLVSVDPVALGAFEGTSVILSSPRPETRASQLVKIHYRTTVEV